MKSIIPDADKCVVCGSRCNLEKHHIMYGTANRKFSEADGLTVMLCAEHHRGKTGVHFNRKLDMELKATAEYIWLKHYNKTIDDWRQRYGMNYLEEIDE